MILAGLALVGLSFFPYSLTGFRYVYSRVFYYAAAGGALIVGILIGVPGGLLATVGIFLPSFIFVGTASLLIGRIRNFPWLTGFLDGLNVASLALMLGVSIQLASTAIVDPVTILIALVAFFLLLRFRINSTWLIAGGALLGLLHILI